MDIVDFWEKQIDKWNEEKHCGFCWAFGAPLEQSQLNIQQLKEDSKCCTQVFLTDLESEKVRTYNNLGFETESYCEFRFNLFVLLPSEIGRNNYNEITGYPLEQSKWKLIFKPLYDCLGCDAIIDFCNILGYQMQVKKWKMNTVFNYADMVYDGWKINAVFRVYN